MKKFLQWLVIVLAIACGVCWYMGVGPFAKQVPAVKQEVKAPAPAPAPAPAKPAEKPAEAPKPAVAPKAEAPKPVTVEEAVALLKKAEADKTPTPQLSKLMNSNDAALAYKVQNAYLADRLKSDSVIGYKGGMTSETLMKVFNTAEPAVAPLFKSGLLPEGAPIVLDRAGIKLEQEIGYRFGAKIDKPLESPEQVKAAVKSIFPAIEVPLVGFPSLKGIGFFDMAAASVGSYQVICGKEVPVADFDVNAIVMKCTLDGQFFNDGKGTDALGDQWGTLLKLINIIIRNGGTIEPDMFIISGAMGKMLDAKPGNYTADFGSFGKIDFVVKKPE